MAAEKRAATVFAPTVERRIKRNTFDVGHRIPPRSWSVWTQSKIQLTHFTKTIRLLKHPEETVMRNFQCGSVIRRLIDPVIAIVLPTTHPVLRVAPQFCAAE
ncbi:hypothetical protein [Bradyrhizobium frederickii]|uniref:hypothetical protein n=1 Tax=Bradyrhizobium frederickii TaxID=2560054 RepID=UPI0013DF94F0|nr:hypothetical protein [Bradyrhizobium frederickii]